MSPLEVDKETYEKQIAFYDNLKKDAYQIYSDQKEQADRMIKVYRAKLKLTDKAINEAQAHKAALAE